MRCGLWNEIEPYLIQDSNGLNIADDAPQEIKDLNKEFDRLIKEQSDFAESLEM